MLHKQDLATLVFRPFMFASLSSFLPSALLQQGVRSPDPISPPPTAPPPPPQLDPPRKKEKKEKHANEAFIIVRPPPSKSAQPLSLQVQLVPPHSRNDRPVQALDSSPDDFGTDLRRTHSNGSEASCNSGFTSAGSVSSFSSSSTASSGRRTIIPLYNLNVHSVMPTTILDAGTDAKVAKFAKRGLEVIGLAFFEPIEVRCSAATHDGHSALLSVRASLDDPHRKLCSTSATFSTPLPVSPARPMTFHAVANDSGDQLHLPSINLTPALPLSPPDKPSRTSRKLFPKIFRRKDVAPPLSITVPKPDETIPVHPSPARNSARVSEEAPVSQPDTPYHFDARPTTPLASPIISQTAILGVHATLYPPVNNPRGRPTKYIWVVRKWLKGSDSSIFNGRMGKLNVGAREQNTLDVPHIEVRFEWSREQKKCSGRRSRAEKSSDSHGSPARTRVPSGTAPQSLSPNAPDHRSSVVSHNSSSSDTGPSPTGSACRPMEESDEESDPEDSETPWTCTVTVERPVLQPSQHHQKEPAIRLKVATLAPTPHHPKVVGLLKMPFPLPDIEVQRLIVRRRLVTAQGISKTTSPTGAELILTAEEIKDTVSSTALWLVVRETFCGVGRDRKKGKS